MSDTPRTDEALMYGWGKTEFVSADFARTLERELMEAKKATSAALDTCAKVSQIRIKAEAERDSK